MEGEVGLQWLSGHLGSGARSQPLKLLCAGGGLAWLG